MSVSKYTIHFLTFCIEIYTSICIFLTRYKQIFIKQAESNLTNVLLVKYVFKYSNNTCIDLIANFAIEAKLTSDEYIKCHWVFNNNSYITFFTNANIKYFLPYTIFNLYFAKPENKIIAGFITDNKTKEIENCTSFLKQLAGPYQNFYSNVPIDLHTKHIWGIHNKTLQIITLKNKFSFDLEKDNILTI